MPHTQSSNVYDCFELDDCYSKLRMDSNSHRSPLELSYYDAFELRHFVISELQTSGAIC